jgi:hypothetical protein
MSNPTLIKARRIPVAGRRLEAAPTQDLGSLDFESVTRVLRPKLRMAIGFWATITVLGFLYLLSAYPAYAFPFGIMSGSSCALAVFWLHAGGRALPLLPLFAFQNGLIYALPLVVRNESLIGYSESLLWPGALSFLVYMCSIGLGWRLGYSRKTGQAARWRFGLSAESKFWSKGLVNIGFLLLGASLVFEILLRSGLYWSLLGGIAWQAFPIIRALFEAAMLLGALLGGLVGSSRGARTCFWLLVGLLFFLKVSDLLISSALGLVVAATIGLLFGRRRMPWLFLIITLAVVGFFNQSKFVMRERYWNKETSSSSVTLAQLPRFYMEWAGQSSAMLFSSQQAGSRESIAQHAAENGQLFYNRIDNLQNLLYVTEALTLKNISTLGGEGYALIPPLLIPRVFWPDKPRTHEGQIVLNLHFGRQATVEETENTNIAWGLLPEAVGNLGLNLGPWLVGMVLGWLLGCAEMWSSRKQILSVEGLLCLALLLQTALCFEMAASVLVTSTFQLVVAVMLGGFLIRAFMLSGRVAKPSGKVLRRDAVA